MSPRLAPKNGDLDFNFFEELKPQSPLPQSIKSPRVVKPFQTFTPNIEMMEFTHQNLNKDFREVSKPVPLPRTPPPPPPLVPQN
jgi:hypothetical protein